VVFWCAVALVLPSSVRESRGGRAESKAKKKLIFCWRAAVPGPLRQLAAAARSTAYRTLFPLAGLRARPGGQFAMRSLYAAGASTPSSIYRLNALPWRRGTAHLNGVSIDRGGAQKIDWEIIAGGDTRDFTRPNRVLIILPHSTDG